jgi:ankyrin repeat protein
LVEQELTEFQEVIQIEGGRNLYNYSFSPGPEPYDELMRLLWNSDQEKVLAYLHERPDVPMDKGNRAYTPLHFAARGGMSEVIRELARRGADLTHKDAHHSSTPLGWACFFGQPEAARALLDAGAVPDENCRENAKCGIEGEWSEVSKASADDYRKVLELIGG